MKIKKIDSKFSIQTVESLIDRAKRYKIDNVNWEKDYPYAPKVEFSILHDGKNIYLKYWVDEKCTLAKVTEDFGDTWTDSCVEFFISFDGEMYYNFEFTCIGKALMSYRKDRNSATPCSKELLSSIRRISSLGTKNIPVEIGPTKWNMLLIIPVELFFGDKLESLDGIKAKANFYKCGDNLSMPHFISWNPIGTEKPDFHVPQYFGDIEFEK